MLHRSKFPKHKTVLLINDNPVKSEEKSGDKFTAVSNMSLLTSLRTGRINNYVKQQGDIAYKGIISTDIYQTYLDYTSFSDGNFDFRLDLCKGKDRLEGITYYQLPNQKDVYCSERLWLEFQDLLKEIELVQPKLIICTGKWGLFMLTGCTSLIQNAGNYKDRKPLGGLNKFRSSILQPSECFNIKDTILIPIFHTVHAMGMADKVTTMELDLQRVAWVYHTIKEQGVNYYLVPDKEYILGTDKDIAIDWLNALLTRLDEKSTKVSIDLETMYHSIIDCIGLADSIDSGICIPFAHKGNANYWSIEDEVEILIKIREVMLHPNIRHTGQNYSYDCQYFFKLWGLDIKPDEDTLILHHILFNYLPKNLAFLASCYCEHYTYWKDDITAIADSPETRWIYNAKDVMYTLEVLEVLEDMLLAQPKELQDLYRFQIDHLSPATIDTMNKGVRVDKKRKEELYSFFSKMLEDIRVSINNTLGFEFNLNSPQQKKKVFSDFLGMTLKTKRGGGETTDAASMLAYIEEYPLYRPFLTLLLEHASLKVFTNNFLGMGLDDDDRARTQYRVAGTDTGRLASTKNVWGKGANLQNIPSKGKIDLRYSLQTFDNTDEEEDITDSLFDELEYEGKIKLPNIKKIFLPDVGKEIGDADYSGADIQIVAADSGCKWLLDYFENPRGNGKVYHYIASEFFQREITEREYKVYKGVFHGSNYLMGIDKLASMAGIPYSQAKELQDFYFHLNPEIRLWHDDIAKTIATTGYLTTIFGRKRWFINKSDPMLMNKAAAFKPSATIADLVNRGWVNLVETYPNIDVLMQTHDSLTCQYDISYAEVAREAIIDCMEIPLVYPACTITIPADLQVSLVSYGDVAKIPSQSREFGLTEKRLIESVL